MSPMITIAYIRIYTQQLIGQLSFMNFVGLLNNLCRTYQLGRILIWIAYYNKAIWAKRHQIQLSISNSLKEIRNRPLILLWTDLHVSFLPLVFNCDHLPECYISGSPTQAEYFLSDMLLYLLSNIQLEKQIQTDHLWYTMGFFWTYQYK